MAFALRRDSNAVKPPIGAMLTNGHPLAANLVGAWLLNEGAGLNCRSLVNSNDVLVMQGSAMTWQNFHGLSPSAAGSISANGNGLKLASPSSPLQPTGVVSLFWYGFCANITGDQSLVNNPSLVSMAANNSNTSPFISYGIHRPSGDATGVAFFDDAGGTFSSHTVTGLITVNYPPISAGLTFQNGGNLNGYFNGRNVYSVARASALTYGTGPFLYTNFDLTLTGGNSNSGPLAIYVWNRELSAAEMLWLSTDPYAMVNWRTPTTRFFMRGFPPLPIAVLAPDPQIPQLLAQ